MRKGDRYVAYEDRRPAERLFVTVMRVAKDRSWADLRCQTWACLWTKRVRLVDSEFPYHASLVQRNWSPIDLIEQEADAIAKFHERS